MSKIQDALNILAELGLPKEQQNERSALTILALGEITPNKSWKKVKQRNIGVHDIMVFIKQSYKKKYAENSRETFRRFTLHQFEQAGIVIQNSDEPDRSTNSPNNVYSLSNGAIKVISAFKSEDWKKTKTAFLKKQGKLADKYNARKKEFTLNAILPDGKPISLSPGKHNKLELSVVKEFRSIFCPNTDVLYIGDTANKMIHIDYDRLKKLGLPVNQHDKLPDVILYDKSKNVLFLIEAVTSHGPVSAKRFEEFESLFKGCKAKRIYISAFLDFNTYKKYSDSIAWETEVWIEDNPKHMIHLNGEKFYSIYD